MPVTLSRPRVSPGHEVLRMRPISRSLSIRPGAAVRRDVTGNRPDGVGEPTTWSAHQTADTRQEAPIEMPAPLPTDALVREAVDTALDSLAALDSQARDTARRFRRQAVDEAQHELAQLVQSTQTLLKLAAMTADASGTTIDVVCETHGIDAEPRTQAALSQMIGRQLEHDWHGLARVIEQSFVGALNAWRDVFEAMSTSPGPCGTAA